MSIRSTAIYRFHVIFIIISMTLCTDIEKFQKFVQNHERHQIAKAVLSKNRDASIMFPDFMLYYKAIVIKTV